MRTRSFFIVATLVVLLVAAAGGVYAYDSAREREITKGISVGGVQVGGLEEEAAKARLRSAVLEPLNQPVVARYKRHRYTLTPAQARVAVDIDGSIAEALRRSRSGNILERTARNLRGQRIDEDIDLDIAYNRRAIRRLVKRISARIDRPARDAALDLENGNVNPTPSATGLAVRASRLRNELRRALLSPESGRRVKVRTEVVQPKVSTEQLAAKYPAVIVVSRGSFKLSLYRNLKFKKAYGIAVGQVGLETPAGLYDGAGIHGTDAEGSIGTAASHGCIRMRIPDVVELYEQVPVNAPVYIA